MALDIMQLRGDVTVQGADSAERRLKLVDYQARRSAEGLTKAERGARGTKGGFDQAGRSSQKLAGDLRNVGRSARESRGAVDTLLKGLSGLGGMASGALSVAGGNMVTSLLGGAADMVTKQIGKGVDFIKTTERGRVALTAITKDAALAGRTLQQLGNYADEAGLDLDDTVTGAQRLLGFGYTLDELLPKMRDMGDLAASTGDAKKFENIANALGQMRSATNAQLEEFNQLRDAGVNALGLLSEATGVEVGQLREMITQGRIAGKVAADLVLEASRRRNQGLAQTLANDTLEGREARFGNLAARRTGEAIEPGVRRYSNAIKGGADILASEQGAAFSKAVGGAAERMLSGIEAGIQALATGNLMALGKQAAASAAEGVTSGAQSLYNAGAGAAGQLEQGWRDRLDQHSPSRVLMDLGFQAGASLVFGFVQGMQGQDATAEIEKFIAEAAERFKVDPNLIRAVIKQESSFDRRAISPMGAKGLMQLMPGTAARFGVTNPFDPRQNIMAGTQYLAQLINEFQDLRLALAAYNAGEGAVRAFLPNRPDVNSYVGGSGRRWTVSEEAAQRAQGIPQNGQTPDYVNSVMRFFTRYQTGVDSPLAVRIVGGQLAPDNSAAIAGLEKQLQELNVEKIGHLENIQLESQRLGRHHAALRRDIADEGGEMVASDLVKRRDEIAKRLDELSKEYEASWFDFEKRIQAIEERIRALRSAGARPSVSLGLNTDLPVLPSVSVDAFLKPTAAVAGLTSAVTDGVRAQFDFSRSLAELEKTGGQAADTLGAFTAEQQRANLALLSGGTAAGKAKEQLGAYVDDLAGGITDGIMRGITEGREGALDSFRGLLLDMTREALRSDLRNALRSLFNVKGEEGEGGQSFNPISWLTGKLFKSVTGPRTPGFNPNAKDNTPAAVRDAGAQAVSAVTGAGEANKRALETTGEGTSRGLANVSQTLLQGLSAVANQIAIGQSGMGFWKGLLFAGASGAISGLLGSIKFGGKGGGGGSSDDGASDFNGGGPSNGAWTGGYITGPGGPTDDKIATWLSNGEYVIKAASVQKLGLNALDYINQTGSFPMSAIHRAEGGPAMPSPVRVSPGVHYIPPPPVRARESSRRGSDRREAAKVEVHVSVKPDAQGRVRSRHQIAVEAWQLVDEGRRGS